MKNLILLCACLFMVVGLKAQKLLKDINTGTSSSLPEELITIGNKTYFIANDGVHGNELWITDGTSNGTKMVKDITVGERSTEITNTTNFNGKLLFTIFANTLSKIFITDGTDTGTFQLSSFMYGIHNFVTVANTFYFIAEDVLWKSDGTPNGTIKLMEYQSSQYNFDGIAYNGLLYFMNRSINSADNGLWVSDGTVSGTKAVKYMELGDYFDKFVIFNSKMYFIVSTVPNGSELWESDGSDLGTHLVVDLTTNDKPQNGAFLLHSTQNSLYFIGGNKGDRRLYKSDGTALGTQPISNFNLGQTLDGSTIYNFNLIGFEFKNKFYFFSHTPTETNQILFESDGTINGTKIVYKFKEEEQISEFSIIDSLILLSYSNNSNNIAESWELWATDGTPSGLRLVKDIYREYGVPSSPMNLTRLGNTVLFSALSKNIGVELWRSDGTETGTTLVKDINSKSGDGIIDFPFNKLGNQLFFNALDYDNGYELWKTDGSTNGTVRVSNFFPGIWGSGAQGWYKDSKYQDEMFEFNNKLFFNAFDSLYGSELRYIDEASSSPQLLKDIMKNQSTGSFATNLAKLKNQFVFIAQDSIYGKELWISEGTEGGTKLLADMTKGTNSTTFFSNFVEYNDEIYFFASSTEFPTLRLWKTNGTTEGTLPIKSSTDIPLSYNSTLSLKRIGNLFFFLSSSQNFRTPSLWVYDGVTSKILTNVSTTPNSYIIEGYYPSIVFNNKLYFMKAIDANRHFNLWKTDGTIQGTTHVSNEVFRYGNNDISKGDAFTYKIFKNNLYFFARDTFSNFKIWKLDSIKGLIALKTIEYQRDEPDYYSSSQNSTEWNGLLYFQGNDGVHGFEIWTSDGTAEGTKMAFDLNSGPNSSFPIGFTTTDNALYFVADDGTTGFELWKLSSTGVLELVKSQLKLTVYPNPVGDVINMQNDENEPIKDVRLYNHAGQLLKSQPFKGQTDFMDVHDLIPATYILEFKTATKKGFKKITKAR